MTTPAPQKPILISGAGLASLLLAQSLHTHKIPFQIYERDTDVSFRGQGYRLRLSSEGLDAVESVLGGPDSPAWRKFWDACGKTGGAGLVAIDAITGEEEKNPPAAAEEKEKQQQQQQQKAGENLGSRGDKIVGIARGQMRSLFMEGCEDAVHWGHHVTGYELSASGDGVRAIFADGSKSIEGAMLIGGEGIRSEVARQLSGGKLKVYDMGARGIHGQAKTPAFRALGEGVFRLLDQSRADGKKLFLITNVRAGDMDDPEVEFGWTMIGQPGLIAAPNDDYSIVGKTAADIAKKLTTGWHPRVRPLFDEMVESEAAFWKITCSSPSGVPQWDNEPRVTVIGDAVHSMTPAGGLGANTALRDSALLGRLIGEAGGFKKGITAAYEKEMRVYGSEAVAKSYGMAEATFGSKIDEATTPTVTSRN